MSASSGRAALIRRRSALLVGMVAVLAACSGSPSAVTWRNITVPVPDGWYVVEESGTHLTLANAELSAAELFGEPPGDGQEVVAMFFTYEPTTLPRDWLEHVERQDGVLESNTQIRLDDDEVPATRIVYAYETLGVPTREMVVVIPSRGVVMLALPIPGAGSDEAPDVFLRHLDTVMQVLEESSYGAPMLD